MTVPATRAYNLEQSVNAELTGEVERFLETSSSDEKDSALLLAMERHTIQLLQPSFKNSRTLEQMIKLLVNDGAKIKYKLFEALGPKTKQLFGGQKKYFIPEKATVKMATVKMTTRSQVK